MDSISEFLSHSLTSDSPLQWLLAVAVAYFGGILSSLTPCVYPMIPITVGVVGGLGGENVSRRSYWSSVLLRGGAYVFGMAVIYSFLGVLAGLTGKVFGSFTNSSAWYLILGLIITIAALMMLDIITLDPIMLWHRLKFRIRRSRTAAPTIKQHDKPITLLGSFTLGATSGFIAAPCTTPVLAAILAYIAKTQSVFLGMALMFAFSAGLGTLLLVIATFAGALKVLPRSGTWMNAVKIMSGILLLGFAEYLIYRAGTMAGITPKGF